MKAGKQYNLLVSEKLDNGYAVFAGNEKGILKMDAFPYKPGDIIKATYDGIDGEKIHVFHPIKTVKVEGALISLDVQTGYILAMVGGRDFEQSPYNRAIAAKIQSGSAFKPFIYLAALKKGYTMIPCLWMEQKEYSMVWEGHGHQDIIYGKYVGQFQCGTQLPIRKMPPPCVCWKEVGVNAVKEVMTVWA